MQDTDTSTIDYLTHTSQYYTHCNIYVLYLNTTLKHNLEFKTVKLTRYGSGSAGKLSDSKPLRRVCQAMSGQISTI